MLGKCFEISSTRLALKCLVYKLMNELKIFFDINKPNFVGRWYMKSWHDAKLTDI